MEPAAPILNLHANQILVQYCYPPSSSETSWVPRSNIEAHMYTSMVIETMENWQKKGEVQDEEDESDEVTIYTSIHPNYYTNRSSKKAIALCGVILTFSDYSYFRQN